MNSRSNRARKHVLPGYTALFKALSDETRLRIFLLLKDELCVCQIQVALAMSQTKISRHLTVLRTRRAGYRPPGGTLDVLFACSPGIPISSHIHATTRRPA